MKTNMGIADSIVRIVSAVLAVVLFFTGFIQGTSGIVLIAVAGVFLLTGVISFCPLYTLFGISTKRSTLRK